MIAKEYDTQRQIDRACAAQSPDMLPNQVNEKKLKEAKERVAHKKPPRDISSYGI